MILKKPNSKLNEGAVMSVLTGQVASSDIRRVVAKILEKYERESISPMLREMDVSGVRPSDSGYMECMRLMTEYCDKHAKDKHPIYAVDVILEKHDVVIKNEGIAYVDPNSNTKDHIVTVTTKMGVLTDSPADAVQACAATLLSYVTNEGETGVENVFKDSQKNSLMRMPFIDGVDVRGAMKTNAKSPAVGRDMIYEQLKSNSALGMILMGRIFSLTSYHKKIESTRNAVKMIQTRMNKKLAAAGQEQILEEPTGASPGIFRIGFNFSGPPPLASLHATRFIIEQTIGSTGGKRGGLTAGYYYMEITPSLIKNILRAKELIALAGEFKVSRIKLPPHKNYGTTLMRILVRNKYTVISSSGSGIDNKEVPGVYVTTKHPCLNVVVSPFKEPSWTKKGIKWEEDAFDESMEIFKSFGPMTVAPVVFTPKIENELYDGGVFYFPGLFPHAAKVWLCSDPTRFEGKRDDPQVMGRIIGNEIMRMASAMFCRVKFPMTRKPFYSADEKSDLFSKDLIIPKIDRKEKNSLDRYKIDVKETEIGDEFEGVILKDVYEKIAASVPDALSPKEQASIRCAWILHPKDMSDKRERNDIIFENKQNAELWPYIQAIPAYMEFVKNCSKPKKKDKEKEVVKEALPPPQEDNSDDTSDDEAEENAIKAAMEAMNANTVDDKKEN